MRKGNLFLYHHSVCPGPLCWASGIRQSIFIVLPIMSIDMLHWITEPGRLSRESRHLTYICRVQDWMNGRMGVAERGLILYEACGRHCCLLTKCIFPSSSLSTECSFYLHCIKCLASSGNEAWSYMTQFGCTSCAGVIEEFLGSWFSFFLLSPLLVSLKLEELSYH